MTSYNHNMILVCPLCQARYLVQANIFASGPRTVRCAKCKHSWKAEAPFTITPIPIEDNPPPEPPPEKAAPIPAGSNLPVIRDNSLPPSVLHAIWGIWGVSIVVLMLWLIVDRQHIAHRWPATETIYDAIHLPIYYPGDGLEFDGVRSELKYDAGINKLILNGKIHNNTDKNHKVPNILAEAISSDGQIIQSWQIDAPAATLAPQQEVAFSSEMNAPKGSVVSINLNFVELKDDSE